MKFRKRSEEQIYNYSCPFGGIDHNGSVGTSFLSTEGADGEWGMTPVEVYIYRFAAAYLILLCFTWRHIRSHGWRDELTRWRFREYVPVLSTSLPRITH